MAYDDALFQLGMDLTRSSTAQEEEYGETAHVAQTSVRGFRNAAKRVSDDDDRKDFLIEREGVRFAGHHLIIDLYGARRLDDLKHVERTLKRCAEVAGATLLHTHLHHFTPNNGVAGMAVLSESHISIHSWPEANYAALDVFMCGETKPHLVIDVLRQAFQARDVVVKEHKRGEEMDQLNWQAASMKQAPARMLPPAFKAKQAA